ncbi:MAG: cytochrome c3 family protein, partial [Gallionella sp.]
MNNLKKFEAANMPHILRSPRWLAMMFLLPLLLMAHFAMAAPAPEKFEHAKTGFSLTGAHISAPCTSCHIDNVFKGTPRNCVTCHTQGNRRGAAAKSSDHLPTNAQCDVCHKTTLWSPAHLNHMTVAGGTCDTCHNGKNATGKHSTHISTKASCDSCHKSSSSWAGAGYNHSNVAPGTCATCHGVTATGKSNNHVKTSASCDTCHRTTGWLPAKFDHTGITTGCASCHNGTTAIGKNNGHVATTAACETCHKSTTSFS